ncbi:MAG: right-handed parallel beta-helix repeat-containing protein [Nitrospirota bacterium]
MQKYQTYLLGALLIIITAIDLPIAEGANLTFFVSPLVGADSNPGTEEKPFASLERARDALRELKKNNRSKLPVGATVVLREGTYHMTQTFVLTQEDSGTNDAPIVYQAYGGEEVRLSGGLAIPFERFQPVTSTDELSQIDGEARDHVLRANLKDMELAHSIESRWDRSLPGKPERPAPEEFIFDDEAMQLARWPNNGWTRISQVVTPGPVLRGGASTGEPASLRVDTDRPSRWTNTDVWLRGFWKWDYFDESLAIKSIDPANRLFTLDGSTLYGIKAGARYFAFNILRELDQEGEYFVDRERAVLFFWPPQRLSKWRARLTLLSEPVLSLSGASYITFRGVIIEEGRDDAVHVQGGQGNHIVNCTIRNFGKDGVVITGGQEHEVSNSSIYNIGLRGVVISGGDRKKLKPAGHALVSNHIHHYGRRGTTYPGVDIDGVGIHVVRNSIHDAPHTGIQFMGNDHVIELNEIHHVCAETTDAGAIYTGRDWTVRGNIIRHNFIHDLLGMDNKGDVSAIYLDDLASGTSMTGNVLARVRRGVKIGGGRDNIVENNVFVNCDTSFSVDARAVTWGSKFLSNDGVLRKRLDRLPYQTAPWSTRYPQLSQILNDDPGIPKRNVVRRNVMYQCAQTSIDPIARFYGAIQDNWETDSDPGFDDMSTDNFGMKGGALVEAKIPGWDNIPFGKIGVHKAIDE